MSRPRIAGRKAMSGTKGVSLDVNHRVDRTVREMGHHATTYLEIARM